MSEILMLAACYFIGAVPNAYIVVKRARGIDIRTVGSGNVGATNAARVLGKWGFVFVFLLDMLKGFVPVYLVSLYAPESYLLLGAAALVVLGHTYTVFLGFKGGKGVATAVGVFLALAPLEVAVAAAAFAGVVIIFRIVSLGSIIAAITLASSVIIHSGWFEFKIFTVLLASFVIYKHKDNVGRIIKGEENRIGKKID